MTSHLYEYSNEEHIKLLIQECQKR